MTARHGAEIGARGLTLIALVVAGPCLAQYKVIAADGSVTYTDRPPVSSNVRVTSLQRASLAPAAEPSSLSSLPLELRQIATRFPVTLYSTNDCAPCDSGRQLLQQRGVPYSERRVLLEDDATALERLLGWRTVPSLTIGAQAMRGFAAGEWGGYLDAAGYPRESRLPRTWAAPAATPMTERAPVAAAPAAVSPTPAPTPARTELDTAPAPPGTIRF